LRKGLPLASATALAMSGEAKAAGNARRNKYTRPVKAALAYLEEHPLQLTVGNIMYYEPDQELHVRLPAVVDSLYLEDEAEVRPVAR
jgi:hypothetical protein